MGDWTLTFDGTTKSLADWGLTNCVISEQSLTAGMFTAQLPGDMLATIPWSYQDEITLALDGVTKFIGTALSPERSGSGDSESIMLKFAEPWWWLTQNSFVQPWFIKATGAAYDAPRAAIFANLTPGTGWVIENIHWQITSIVNQCASWFGGKMQMGTVTGPGFTTTPIPQRLLNVTYEAALHQVLAWVPDAVQQWDYSTTPPKLNFVQRSAATVRTYAFADGVEMTEQKLKKRDDLVVEGIQITYTGLDHDGNVTKQVDAAGATTGTRILRTVIDCTGNGKSAAPTAPVSTPAVTREYTVVSEYIDYTSPDWWFEYGDTGAASAADIIVGSASTIDIATYAPENAGKSDLGGCVNQWLSGGIPRTLVDSHSRMALVTGYLIVRTTATEGSEATPIISTETQERRRVRLLMPATDLDGDYTQIVAAGGSVSIGPDFGLLSPIFIVPGAAATMLAAWSVPQYDGEIMITKDECDEVVQLGDVINLTGGESEWTAMNTQVHSITRQIDTGTTVIQVGFAKHLCLDEFFALIKMRLPDIKPALDLDQQATGGPDEGDTPATNLDDLVSPGSVKADVNVVSTSLKISTAVSEYKLDMTDGT